MHLAGSERRQAFPGRQSAIQLLTPISRQTGMDHSRVSSDPGVGARCEMPVEALVRLEMPGSGRFRRPPVGLAMAAPTCSCQIGRTARLACTRRSRRQTKMVHAYRARRRLCNVDLKRAV